MLAPLLALTSAPFCRCPKLRPWIAAVVFVLYTVVVVVAAAVAVAGTVAVAVAVGVVVVVVVVVFGVVVDDVRHHT